jgi:hypothetical protein
MAHYFDDKMIQKYISDFLESLGMKLLSQHARIEQNSALVKGYVPILIREAKKNIEKGDYVLDKLHWMGLNG